MGLGIIFSVLGDESYARYQNTRDSDEAWNYRAEVEKNQNLIAVFYTVGCVGLVASGVIAALRPDPQKLDRRLEELENDIQTQRN